MVLLVELCQHPCLFVVATRFMQAQFAVSHVPFIRREWTFSHFEATPQQKGGSDCGIFTLEIIRHLVERPPCTLEELVRELRVCCQ